MRTDSQKIMAFLQNNPGKPFSDEYLATQVLGWTNRDGQNRGFNHRAAKIERELTGVMPGLTRRKLVDRKVWQYTPPAGRPVVAPTKPATTKEVARFRGQGTKCRGTLEISLSGPQGSGKSLVAELLQRMLPLMPVAAVVIRSRQTEPPVAPAAPVAPPPAAPAKVTRVGIFLDRRKSGVIRVAVRANNRLGQQNVLEWKLQQTDAEARAIIERYTRLYGSAGVTVTWEKNSDEPKELN